MPFDSFVSVDRCSTTLHAIRSKGGKFTVVDVKDIHTSDNVILVLNSLVTELFGGQITKDVKLTITTERHSKIKEVYAGRYPHSFDDSGSVTISFGHLAPEERRSASVLLALEEVQKPCGMEVAEYIVSHGYVLSIVKAIFKDLDFVN